MRGRRKHGSVSTVIFIIDSYRMLTIITYILLSPPPSPQEHVLYSIGDTFLGSFTLFVPNCPLQNLKGLLQLLTVGQVVYLK